MALLATSLTGTSLSGFTSRTVLQPTSDVVASSEPPLGSDIVPGIPNSLWGDIARGVIGLFTPGEPTVGPFPPTLQPPPTGGDPLGLGGPCPGLFEIQGPDGTCIDLTAILPGGDPAVTGQVPVNGIGPSRGFGQPVNGRFGVGVVPRVEVQSVRRCPKGMALGKDGVCYDGLGRNSPKREWPMGMKPLLTPGERNAIRIAGRAAGKLSRSKKTLRKTARDLEKAC